MGKEKRAAKDVILSLILSGVLVAVMIFVSDNFGSENILTSMMMVASAVLIYLAKIRENAAHLFVRVLIANIICGFAASVVYLNVYVGIAVNLVVIFLQTGSMFKDKGKQVFFPFNMAYIYMMACSPVALENIWPRMLILIAGALMCFAAQALSMRKQKKEGLPADEQKSAIEYFKGLFAVHSVRYSYALRRAIGVTVVWFIVSSCDIEYGNWIVLSVNAVITPYVPDSADKFLKRIAGGIAGTVIFFTSMALTDSVTVCLVIIALSVYGGVLFFSQYAVRFGCITMMSLGMAALGESGSDSVTFVLAKPLSVLIGGLTAFAINRLVLPCRE